MTRSSIQFAPSLPGALFTGGRWIITLGPREFRFQDARGKEQRLGYGRIRAIKCTPGIIWASVVVDGPDKSLSFDGIPNDKAGELTIALQSQVSEALSATIQGHEKAIAKLAAYARTFLGKKGYLCHSKTTAWSSEQSIRATEIEELIAVFRHPLFSTANLDKTLGDNLGLLVSLFSNDSDAVHDHNERFIVEELARRKAFFDTVEASPLTDEQRRAAVTMEDRNLLVAAAGSGKTSSLVSKIGYHLTCGHVAPEEVLVLAFNRNAAEELKERIQRRLSALLDGKEIRVETFHSFGLDVIASVNGVKPSLAESASDETVAGHRLISGLADEISRSDKTFLSDWATFQAIYARPSKDPASFQSADEWKQFVRDTGDYTSGRDGYRTLNGELVKSQGELAIANWLFVNGVDYEYERPYEYETADRHRRQYHPDFYFPSIGCYLEHYGLDSEGRPPPAYAEKYLESMRWKQALHQSMGTNVIETYYSDLAAGTLFSKLESLLKREGAEFKKRSAEVILSRVRDTQEAQQNALNAFITTFIKHAKSNQVSSETLQAKAATHSERGRATAFVRLILKMMDQYARDLAQSGNIDFEDMVLGATRYASEGRYQHTFKLILVDEFQDISRARAELLAALLKHASECKLFAVGDDWQSIYRFAGSDVSLFTNFERTFGKTATNFLTRTFRSNQGIADVATRFVTANPAQIRKPVAASNPTTERVISIRWADKRGETNSHIRACLEEVRQRSGETHERRSVYLLARYNHQKPTVLNELRAEYGGSIDLEFKTIHRAKGLEADYVVLLGMDRGRSGFPSLIADDPLLELVMPSPEQYPSGEERRLFYVALTRAKNEVHLIGNRYRPSSFVDELEAASELAPMLRYPETEGTTESGESVEVCPSCRKGRVTQRTGRYGAFLGCSRYPACDYTRDLDGRRSRRRSARSHH